MEQKSTHSGHEHGFIDTTEVATHIRVNARQTEDEILLKKLLGVDVQVMDEKGIAGQVASRLFEGMATTRDGLDRAGFESKLEKKLKKAFKRLHVEHAHPAGENEHLEKVKLVTEAIRDLAPPELLREFAKSKVQAFVSESKDVGSNRFRVNCDILDMTGLSVVNRPVEIDFQHPFWQKEYKTQADLESALKGKPAREVGVSFPAAMGVIPHPDNAKLEPTDVQNIVNGAMNVLDSSKTLDPLERKAMPTGGTPPDVDVHVDIRRLMEQRTSTGALIASLDNAVQFATALQNDAHVRNCIRFSKKLDEKNLGSYALLWDNLSKEIFTWVRGPGVKNGPLAMKGHRVFELYERSRKQAETYKKIAAGTVNEESTVIVLTLLQAHEDLHKVIESTDKQELLDELSEKQDELAMTELIERASVDKIPASKDSLKDIQEKRNEIKKTSVTASATVVIGSTTTNPETWDVGATQKDIDTVRTALKERDKQLADEERMYLQCLQNMEILVKKIKPPKAIPSALTPFLSSSANWQAQWKSDVDLPTIYKAAMKDLKLKKKEEYKEEIEKLEKKIKEGGEGLKGADAQFAILKKYFMDYKNMSEEDAKKAANYLLARSMMNADMSHFAEELVTETYGPVESEGKRQNKYSQRVILEVARGCGIGVDGVKPSFWEDDRGGPDTKTYAKNPKPHWSKASYEQLLTAYYAMRTLEKDKAHALHYEATPYFREQMAEIIKLLTEKHNELFWQEFGPVAATKGKDVEDKAKEPMTQEKLKKVMRQFAESEMPKGYEEKVKKAIDYADRRVERKWRATKRALAATGGAMARLLWKNKTYSAKSAVTKTANIGRGFVATLNRNKGNIALFALGTVVAGPFVAAAALAMKKAVDGPSAPAGGGEHHPS